MSDDSYNPSPDPMEEGQLKKAALIPMVLAMLGVAAVAGLVFWQNISRQPPAQRTPDTMGYGFGAEVFAHDPLANMMMGPHAPGPENPQVADLMSHPADQPFEAEPCGLEAFAGATRVFGFRREINGYVDEVAVWTVTTEQRRDAMRHYHQQLDHQGFMRVDLSEPGLGPGRGRIFVRYDPMQDANLPPQTFVLRARQAGEGKTNVLLWFRYPVTSS